MKLLSIITAVITALLLLSSLLCGLWIKSHNHTSDKAALSFHMKLGIISVSFGLISVILLIIKA